jgi:hypothetical protein
VIQKTDLERQIGLKKEQVEAYQTLTVSFKKHWCSLAKTTVAANQAASESERNSVWWCFLTLNRTVLEENPPD